MPFEIGHKVTLKHGFAVPGKRRRVYNIWRAIKQRTCSPTHKDYYKYGAIGIKICDRWRDSFENFLEDLGEPPSKYHSIDRFPDKLGNYEPGNVRWATAKEQARNRKSSAYLTALGKTKLIVEWAEDLGWKPYVIRNRLRQGWNPNKIVSTPVRKRKNNKGK